MSKKTSRTARTIRSLLLMAGLGAVLAIYNVYSNNRDVAIATGTRSEAQKEFFVNASERPDINVFFKSLTPEQRLKMSSNIGQYDDPAMAKLLGKCLESFDPAARAELTKSMAVIAKGQPKAVAEQLALKGSFQQLAVSKALRDSGSDVITMVAERLTNGDARPNASAYLVTTGLTSVPAVLPFLENKDKDVRLAAADVLGKLRARAAVSVLTDKYKSTTGDEQYGYLASLAGIGDPASQGLLESALKDEALPVPQRAQAALGLGRIASVSAVDLLWSYDKNEQQQLRESAISALQIAGDISLQHAGADVDEKLKVAQGIQTPLANSVIETSLGRDEDMRLAAQSAHGRPAIVPTLIAALAKVDASTDGDVADELVDALASTPRGKDVLKALNQPALAGIVERRLNLQT